MGGETENKANSASAVVGVELEIEAELGKKNLFNIVQHLLRSHWKKICYEKVLVKKMWPNLPKRLQSIITTL